MKKDKEEEEQQQHNNNNNIKMKKKKQLKMSKIIKKIKIFGKKKLTLKELVE